MLPRHITRSRSETLYLRKPWIPALGRNGNTLTTITFTRVSDNVKTLFSVRWSVVYHIKHFMFNIFPRRLSVCLSVSLSVFSTGYLEKTDAARIIECDVERFHDESWKPINFKVKGQGHEVQKTVPSCLFAFLWVLASSSFILQWARCREWSRLRGFDLSAAVWLMYRVLSMHARGCTVCVAVDGAVTFYIYSFYFLPTCVVVF